MMAEGFLEEVRGLRQRPQLHAGLPAIRAVGYRQLWRHLEGECSLEEAVQAAVVATRQLAKRQLTWLRKWPDLGWIFTDYDGKKAISEPSGEALEGRGADSPLAMALNYLTRSPL